MSRSYIPSRLGLLERFGAHLHAYLMLRARGAESALTRARVVDAGARYLRAGGGEGGLRRVVEHVQDQVAPLLEDWYDVRPGSLLLSGADGELADELVAAALSA